VLYLATPSIVAIASATLDKVARDNPNSGHATGLPGTLPITQAGVSVTYSDDQESLGSVKVTYVKPEGLQAWHAQCDYFVTGLIVYYENKIYRVNKAHVARSVSSDLQSQYISDITGIKDPVKNWEPGKLYKVGKSVQYNGQLLVSTKDHISAVLSKDCSDGSWKFIANLYVGAKILNTQSYSFAGHLIDDQGVLYACVKSHPLDRWQCDYWVRLHPEQSQPSPVGGLTYRTAQPIPALTVVAVNTLGDIVPADCTNISHYGAVLGVCENAYPEDRQACVKSLGTISESGWNWTPGRALFVSPEGRLTQDFQKRAAFSQVVAMALSPTLINVFLHQPVILSKR
jgi:hypothetical protein